MGQPYLEQKLTEALGQHGEIRNIVANICWTPPLEEAMQGDTLTFAQVVKFMKATFWDSQKNAPMAPDNWPRNLNIPIKVFSKTEWPTKGEMQRYGLDIVVASFRERDTLSPLPGKTGTTLAQIY